MARGEFALVRALRERAKRGPVGPGVLLGIGDDCAVLRPPPGSELLFTTDMLVEGRHFDLADASPADVGWKALAASVSDVAAMGGRPLWAVLSLALRPAQTEAFADALLDGVRECAAACGAALVGGDISAAGDAVVVNVALLGAAPSGRSIRRDGARPGDAICVTGALGGSLAGRHLRPALRHEEAVALVQGSDVHAMIDLSDGLSSDLGHVLDASGVGAVVDGASVPLHPDAVAASRVSGRSALEHALHDGEDYELCFTVAAADAERLGRAGLTGTAVTCVGRVTAERDYLLAERANDDGSRSAPMERRGHDHFRGA